MGRRIGSRGNVAVCRTRSRGWGMSNGGAGGGSSKDADEGRQVGWVARVRRALSAGQYRVGLKSRAGSAWSPAGGSCRRGRLTAYRGVSRPLWMGSSCGLDGSGAVSRHAWCGLARRLGRASGLGMSVGRAGIGMSGGVGRAYRLRAVGRGVQNRVVLARRGGRDGWSRHVAWVGNTTVGSSAGTAVRAGWSGGTGTAEGVCPHHTARPRRVSSGGGSRGPAGPPTTPRPCPAPAIDRRT